MIEKPLIILSIIFTMVGLKPASLRYDQAIAKLESGNNAEVIASEDPSQIGFPEITRTPKVKPFTEKPAINAYHYALGDMESGKILFKQAASEKVPIASTTKIMTAIIALENYKPTDVMTVSPQAASQIGAEVFLRAGEQITFEQLLYCMLLKSGNDSAYAIAEHLSAGSDVTPFVALMNKKAKQLGMSNTEYHDPAGLDITGYSSAEDLFLVTRYALDNKVFRSITSTAKYSAHNLDSSVIHPLENSNRLVNQYEYMGAIGVKTGYMPEAGHCLVAAVEREGHVLISVVLRTFSDTAPASADESKKIQDWGWANIEWR